jgi:tRNA(Arg) A34 adenosine deaminase TadA
MCLGAMVHARIEKVVFGAFDERAGVCGHYLEWVGCVLWQ